MSKARPAKSTPKKAPGAKREAAPKGATTPSSMNTKEIRDLIDFISKTGLNEVDIETRELKLHIKREPDQKILKSTAPMVTSVAPVHAAPAQTSAPVPAQQGKAERPEAPAAKGGMEIKSPMIGTFYRSANPDTPPFVSVGDKISKGQVVCIIEAMKLFNEIESEISGTVVKVLVDNASPVEYDQVLFLVQPD